MNHLLILYNPYYQSDVIKQHLSILQEKSLVAFGKIKSKLNDRIEEFDLEQIYQATREENFLQLFLSDYANLFVAKVIKVSKNIEQNLIPSYYRQKHLERKLIFFINGVFSKNLSLIQKIRNEAVHAKAASFDEAKRLRNMLLGIENESLLKGVLIHKEKL